MLPAWIAYLAWRRMSAPRARFLTTAHGIYTVNPYSEIMTRGECVIAVSETVREHLVQAYPRADPQRMRVIHRGVDQKEFPRGHRPSRDWLRRWYEGFPRLRDKLVITLPGRLTRLKGHREFFDLVATLSGNEPRVHGLVVGGEDAAGKRYARELQREAGARDLPITFAGHRDDMPDVYGASDLVLSLSRHPESFGRVVVEALSIGVPVIGYDHGGVGEVLARVFPEGRVRPGDTPALAERCRAFLDTPPTTAAPIEFGLDTMLEKTLGVYGELAQKGDS
jgi:glycosyltransferase involved in cell wall biosynthesis